MGCGSSEVDATKPNKKRETVFGTLEVKILEAHIEHETSKVFSMDPYVNIKFSNQTRKGEVVKKGGKNPKFNDLFKFHVNSCYKYYGRCLEIELMDSNTASDSVIGYGIIDLDPYLNALQAQSRAPEQGPTQGGELGKAKDQTANLRCFLNFDRQQAGFIVLAATFKEQKTDIINFRFETAEFKRSTRTFGEMQNFVRVTVGQQVLQTKKSKDTKTEKPVWKDEHLSFTFPHSCEEVLIQVMDEEELVGSITMQKLDFTQESTEISIMKEIKYKNDVAGKLWFNTLTKSNPIFKELTGDYKKKLPEPEKKKEEKKEDKKEEKKEDKKEEDKKQEKKEEKKQDKKEEDKKQSK